MNRERLLRRLSQGAVNNVAFDDFVDLVEGFGFTLDRVAGSHRIYAHPLVDARVNLQAVRGEAKPYQIRQFLRLVEQFELKLERDA
jgi:predicted RNA binding protein YcfA (HicA-like mRNA interferase family)